MLHYTAQRVVERERETTEMLYKTWGAQESAVDKQKVCSEYAHH